MREQDSYLNSCLIGSASCGLGEQHELALVQTIMQTIKHYGDREHVEPCPRCLRNSMLTVAALLHLEAARIDAHASGRSEAFDDDFAEVARERLQAVTEVVPGNVIQFKQ
jgi:hypothetical protein